VEVHDIAISAQRIIINNIIIIIVLTSLFLEMLVGQQEVL